MLAVETAPYGDTAADYFDSGWQPIPLPAGKKWPPPDGVTGHAGRDVTEDDVLRWSETRTTDNIGLRLPADVIGIDVDAYHGGSDTLAALIGELGELPATWRSTSRDDGSGILFYRVPSGLAWKGSAGAGIDVIQRGHRYAVVWPSIHPSGSTYRWFDPSGAQVDEIPSVSDLPDLPATWVAALSEGEAGEPAERLEQTEEEMRAWLASLPAGSCPRVEQAAASWISALESNRHDNMLRGVYELVKLGREGHRGAPAGLRRLRDAFEAALDGERAARPEFARALKGAIARAAVDPAGEPCACAGTSESEPDDINEIDRWFNERVLDLDSLARVPELEPLVDGWLWLDSVAWLVGQWGSAKSFVALDMACCVASGTPWQGCVTAHGPVLYIAAEGGRGIYPRVRAWQTYNRATPRQLRVLPEPVQVTNAAYWDGLIRYAKRMGAVLVVIDTQARVTVGLEENSARDMGLMVDRAEDLRRETGATVLLIHHLGKDASRGMRGASALPGAAQSILNVTKPKGSPEVTVSTEKQKDHAFADPITLILTDIEGTGSAALVPESSRYTPAQDAPENENGAGGLSPDDFYRD